MWINLILIFDKWVTEDNTTPVSYNLQIYFHKFLNEPYEGLCLSADIGQLTDKGSNESSFDSIYATVFNEDYIQF